MAVMRAAAPGGRSSVATESYRLSAGRARAARSLATHAPRIIPARGAGSAPEVRDRAVPLLRELSPRTRGSTRTNRRAPASGADEAEPRPLRKEIHARRTCASSPRRAHGRRAVRHHREWRPIDRDARVGRWQRAEPVGYQEAGAFHSSLARADRRGKAEMDRLNPKGPVEWREQEEEEQFLHGGTPTR